MSKVLQKKIQFSEIVLKHAQKTFNRLNPVYTNFQESSVLHEIVKIVINEAASRK